MSGIGNLSPQQDSSLDTSLSGATGHLLAYITAGSLEEAKRLGRGLVEARLAACANVLPGMTSIYTWQHRVEESEEVVLIAKTRRERAKKLVAFVRGHHSYDCPAVVLLPAVGGNPAFLEWIDAETGPLPEPED